MGNQVQYIDEGQLVQVVTGESWQYGYIKAIYDDRCEIIKKDGSRLMHFYTQATEKELEDDIFAERTYVYFLRRYEKIVYAKKNWYGKVVLR